jgi:hypothetical protein
VKANLTKAGLLALAAVTLQVRPAHAAVSGAIFTTIADGTIVNANTQYTSKCDVYLDGGPGANAPAKAAGLPNGLYYFQVTDPSGQTLLSTDPVSNRQFQVSGGVITAYTGTGGPVHAIGIDQVHPELGALTIQVANSSCPTDYKDTPNSGGVYKVWVTPSTSFVGDPTKVDNACANGCYHGFASSASKTDSFKVKPMLATFCLSVTKQIVAADTTPGANWQITVTDPTGGSNTYYTDVNGNLSVCSLAAGTYTVSESQTGPDGSAYDVFGLFFDGISLPLQPSYTFTWSAGQPAPVVVFQNELHVSPF